MFEENSIRLSPVHFFTVSCDCRRLDSPRIKDSPYSFPDHKKYSLPDASSLCVEDRFALVFIGWCDEGLGFDVRVLRPFQHASYPDIERGDSIELFIDTRDLKSAGFNTRFCHHFFFLPESVSGYISGEITRFRTEDTHPLCESKFLYSTTEMGSKQYAMKIFIPSKCLHGYDPRQFDRLGFTYRINRCGGKPQHFSVTKDYSIDQQPSLWSSLRLIG